MKQCLYCGKEFDPAKPKQVFCSTKCRTYYFRKKNKKEDATTQAPLIKETITTDESNFDRIMREAEEEVKNKNKKYGKL